MGGCVALTELAWRKVTGVVSLGDAGFGDWIMHVGVRLTGVSARSPIKESSYRVRKAALVVSS